ncbi:MAG: N-acetylmuramoyl-L-alanine amidase [Lachnospiraceae bacterium]|nr:N-acetylmuramoyl-L-alanine amidase [Lachnospiraceae bacterium]RKJ48848.1 N-acetylmuramoyl-L-alanine amidase [bacterium 1XD42-54]
MAKVILDAGHGGPEPGAVYEGRNEKDDTLRLALAVGEILERNGVDVAFTRTEDVYDTPFEKAQIANREGGDFLISIHRNSSPEANQYSGVETLVYDKSGKKVELAENINEALSQVGFRNLGVKERPGLVVLRRSQMPAVLVEAGFLNTDADNELFDEQFDAVARAIADGVLKTLGAGSIGAQERYYRVQTGAFRRREYAEDLLYQLLGQNFPAYILYEDNFYKVQVGAFRQLDNAVRMEEALRRKGYSTFLTT